MKHVLLAQFNNEYGNQIYVPYSIGVLKSYAQCDPEICCNFKFDSFVYSRKNIDDVVDNISHKIDIVGISCYVWNWEISLAFAEKIKSKYPDSLVILGGPHVPNQVESTFFKNKKFIDILCQGEGEQTFVDILKAFCSKDKLMSVAGTAGLINGCFFQNPARQFINDLNIIPSPYLSGIFDYLFADSSIKWMVIWETNRGCPFNCAFCDWGSLSLQKLRLFNEERLLDELDFFSQNKIELIFGADSNFGILKRDVLLAEKIIELKTTTNYPKEFRVCFTKNSTDRIFCMAKNFAKAGINKGVSISMQSLNTTTLNNINRKNIKLEVFKILQKKYFDEGLVNYTELILPLPGETYDSFTDGLCSLLNNLQHSGIIIYNCSVVPNAVMGNKKYQEKYGLDLVTIPIFQAHSNKKTDQYVEKEDIVVATYSMSRKDWRKTYRFAWAIQTFHILGLLQIVAITLNKHYNISYREFYEGLLHLSLSGSVIQKELFILNKVLNNVLKGGGFNQFVPNCEQVVWPTEEASFLRILTVFDKFYNEVFQYVVSNFCCDPDLIKQLILFQKMILHNFWDDKEKKFNFDYDFKSFIEKCKNGEECVLEKKLSQYIFFSDSYYNNIKDFSKEVLWFGRKGGKFLKRVDFNLNA